MGSLDLTSLQKALGSLKKAVEIAQAKISGGQASQDEIELMKAGVIQNFEFTYELCWKFMKRWIENNIGAEVVDGVTRRELFRLSGENRLIADIDQWMEFHYARNLSTHTYNRAVADEVYGIAVKFRDAAEEFFKNLERRNA